MCCSFSEQFTSSPLDWGKTSSGPHTHNVVILVLLWTRKGNWQILLWVMHPSSWVCKIHQDSFNKPEILLNLSPGWCGTWTRKHICIGGEKGSAFFNFPFLYNYQEKLAVYLLLCECVCVCALAHTHTLPTSTCLLLAAFLAPPFLASPETPSFLSLFHVLAFNSLLANLKWKERDEEREGERRGVNNVAYKNYSKGKININYIDKNPNWSWSLNWK